MNANIHNANGLEQIANARIPPAWGPEMERNYPFRIWEQDIELWGMATDIEEARRAPTIALRVSGSAKLIVREIGADMLQNGRQQRDANGNLMVDNIGNPIMLTGTQALMHVLRTRFGALPQEVQLSAVSDLMTFARLSHEDTDQMLSRFEVVVHRADQVGGVQINSPIKAWMLLTHLRIPRDRWPTLLAPTIGQLPGNDVQYAEFTSYLRRNGHLYDRQDTKTIMQPYFLREFPGQLMATHSPTQFTPVDQTYYQQNAEQWNVVGMQATTPIYITPFSTGDSTTNLAEDDVSFSSGWSMLAEEIHWDDDDEFDNDTAEKLYFAYRHAKRKFRAVSGPRRRRLKGKGKGKQHRKPHHSSTFYGEASPEQWSDSHEWTGDPQEPSTYYKGGSGSGKGNKRPFVSTGNPWGPDGKQLTCRLCQSTLHFAAKCPTKGGGKGMPSKSTQFNRNPASFPVFSTDSGTHSSSSGAMSGASAPQRIGQYSTFIDSVQDDFLGGTITFADGSPSVPVRSMFDDDRNVRPRTSSAAFGEVPSSSQDNSQQVQIAGRRNIYPTFLPGSDSAGAYHSRVRLSHGEALVLDTGAVRNVSGDAWVQRTALLAETEGRRGTEKRPLPKPVELEGVGSGTSSMTHSATVPIALNKEVSGVFETGVINNSEIPALLGLEGMEANHMIIDAKNKRCYLIGPGGYDIKLSPNSTVHALHKSPTGHLMLPVSNWEGLPINGSKKSVTFMTNLIDDDHGNHQLVPTTNNKEQVLHSNAQASYQVTVICDVKSQDKFVDPIIVDPLKTNTERETRLNHENPAVVWIAADGDNLNHQQRKVLKHDLKNLANRQVEARRHVVIQSSLDILQSMRLKHFRLILVTLAFLSLCSCIPGTTALEQTVLTNIDLDSEAVYTANAVKEAVTKKKRKPNKPYTEEGDDNYLGEHADAYTLETVNNTWKPAVEDSWTDCGDDVGPIELAEEAFAIFSDCEETSDVEFEKGIYVEEIFFDCEFYTWTCTDETRAFASQWDSHCAYAALDAHPGKLDIAELFGGKEGIKKIAIRRQLKCGINWDLEFDIDMMEPINQTAFLSYLDKHQPFALISGPPCTSLGGWSFLNRKKHPESWARQRRIGETLSKFCAKACKAQLRGQRHFFIENPQSSDQWGFSEWLNLEQHVDVTSCISDQCMLGLVDPDGKPTRKRSKFLASDWKLLQDLDPICDGCHIHQLLEGNVRGISRTKFAQTWPRRMIEILLRNIKRLMNGTTNMYPIVGEECIGCRAHAARHDVRHTRIQGQCRFYRDTSVQWTCPSCIRHLGSTHIGHTRDDNCQWTFARARARGPRAPYPEQDAPIPPALPEPRPGILRQPRPPLQQIASAAANVPDPGPPAVPHLHWEPLNDLETITIIDSALVRGGWSWTPNREPMLIMFDGRALQTSEPRHDSQTWQWRSTFVVHPDYSHAAGTIWQLESYAHYVAAEYDQCIRLRLGYTVDVLIHIFHKDNGKGSTATSAPAKENSPDGAGALAAAAARAEQANQAIAESGREEEGAQEPDALGPQPDEQPDIRPDWSSFDLGTALRALKSEDPQIQIRALRRLHTRWFHCSSKRMQEMLIAAGVNPTVAQRSKDVVMTCRACRLWKRPSPSSVGSSRLSTTFNKACQLDLLFFESHVICHIIDESTRYTVAFILADKTPQSLLEGLTLNWVRQFGPPSLIISDREGAMTSDEASTWAEHWNIGLKFKAVGAHAHIVERHHEILRDLLHKLCSALRLEQLAVSIVMVLSEACFAKNALTSVNGYSPYNAVFGRSPNFMLEIEEMTASHRQDAIGNLPGASRHITRLRELAITAITEATAKSRMQLAERTNTRSTAEAQQLQAGQLVEIWRAPPSKDLVGWRGPCEIISVAGQDDGVIDVRWRGRTLAVRAQDVRAAVLFMFLTFYDNDEEEPMTSVRNFLKGISHGIFVLAYVQTPEGWRMSKAAKDNPNLYQAVLHIAAYKLGLRACVGARLGRCISHLNGLVDIESCVLLWWPARHPSLYKSWSHPGQAQVPLKQLFEGEIFEETCWIQFLCTDRIQARVIRKDNPLDITLGYDPEDDGRDYPDDTSMATTVNENGHPYRPPPYPPPSYPPTPMISRQSAMSGQSWPQPPMSGQAQQFITPAPTISAAMTQASLPSTLRYPHSGQGSVASTVRYPETHNIATPTSTQQSKQRSPEKRTRFELTATPSTATVLPGSKKYRDHSTASSSNAAPSVQLPIDGVSVPITSSSSASSRITGTIDPNGGHAEIDDDQTSVLDEQDEDWNSYVASVQVLKPMNELTHAEVQKNWDMVLASAVEEITTFVTLGCFLRVPRKLYNNILTSRFLFKWKEIDGKRQVKGRLVVRGFQDRDSPTLMTYANTATRWGQRIVTSVCAQNLWHILSADVGNAFLRGLTFQELAEATGEEQRQVCFDIPMMFRFIMQRFPDFCHMDWITETLLMVKAIYGLKDAPRAWRKKLHVFLMALNSNCCKVDSALYFWKDAGKLVLFLSAHVDDLKLGGEDKWVDWLIEHLEQVFGKLKVKRNNFEHCGLLHEQCLKTKNIKVHQNHYTKNLQLINLSNIDMSDHTVKASKDLHDAFMSLLGGVGWLCQTRPEICVYVQALQRVNHSPTLGAIVKLNTLTKWVKRKQVHVLYQQLQTSRLRIIAISDAAYRREDQSGLAMRGAMICLAELHPDHPGGLLHPVEWYSKRQRRVVRSTFGGELNALGDAHEQAKVIAFCYSELMLPEPTSAKELCRMDELGSWPLDIEAIVDCRSVFDALACEEPRKPTECSLVMLLLQLKEQLLARSLKKLWWSTTTDMVADALNKGAISRIALMKCMMSGEWKLHDDTVFHETPANSAPPLPTAVEAIQNSAWLSNRLVLHNEAHSFNAVIYNKANSRFHLDLCGRPAVD